MKIILSSNPVQSFGAIVIDHKGWCFWKDGRCIRVGGLKTFRFVAAVLAAWPNSVQHLDMYDHVWGDYPDEGPLQVQRGLFVRVVRERKSLRQLGITIHSRHLFGWRAYFPGETKSRPIHSKFNGGHYAGTTARSPASSPAAIPTSRALTGTDDRATSATP